MSLYMGKNVKTNKPSLHFTKGRSSIFAMSSGPQWNTLFHSDLDYLQIQEKILVNTWAKKGTQGSLQKYEAVIPSRIKTLISQGYLFTVVQKTNRYVRDQRPKYGGSPVNPRNGDIQYGNVNTVTQNVGQSLDVVIEHSPRSPYCFPFSRMPPYNVVNKSGGKARRNGSLYVGGKSSRPTTYAANGSGSFPRGSNAYDPDDIEFSSNSFGTSQSGTANINSGIKYTPTEAGTNRNSLVPVWYVLRNKGYSLPSRLYYNKVGRGNTPSKNYTNGITPPGYMFLFYNVRVVNNSYKIIKPPVTSSTGIHIDRTDVKVGASFSLKNSELTTEIPVSSAVAKISQYGKIGYDFNSGQTAKRNDPLFKFLNNIYYPGRTWTAALADLTHNAGLTVWVGSNGKIKAWRARMLADGVAQWTIKPSAMLNNPGLQLTKDTLSFTSGSRKVEIVTPTSGLLKLTGRELNLTVPQTRFTYADAVRGAKFIKGNFYRPFQQSGGHTPGYYQKEEVVGSVPLPPGISGSNYLTLMIEPTVPKGTFSVQRGGTCWVKLNYTRSAHPAPLRPVVRRPGYNTNIVSQLFKGRFTATDITTQKFTYASNRSANKMQGISVEYLLRMNWSSMRLEVVRRLWMANAAWRYVVIRGDGNVYGQTNGFGTRDVIYQIPPIVVNAFVTSASKYAT